MVHVKKKSRTCLTDKDIPFVGRASQMITAAIRSWPTYHMLSQMDSVHNSTLKFSNLLPAKCGVSILQLLLRPDYGSLMSRNLLPIKRLLNNLFGPAKELNIKCVLMIDKPMGMSYIERNCNRKFSLEHAMKS